MPLKRRQCSFAFPCAHLYTLFVLEVDIGLGAGEELPDDLGVTVLCGGCGSPP